MLHEVREILGRQLTCKELYAYREMRKLGFANAYDIVDMLKEW